MDISDSLSRIVDGGVVVVTGIIGWLMRGYTKRTEKTEADIIELGKQQTRLRDYVHDFQLEADRTYAKENTIQMSLSRVYSVLDAHASSTEQSFKDLRNDVKDLIKAVNK